MQFDNSFEVPLTPAQAWPVLMDIQRITPCMPGAELIEIVDPATYRGKIFVRLGPVALAFVGTVKFEEIDAANYRARVRAHGSDDKGRGAAQALATFRLEPADAGSRVLVHTDLTLTGMVAQYGRGVGMIQATAAALIAQFAGNLRAEIARDGAGLAAAAPRESTPAPAAAARPIAGFSLICRAVWLWLLRLFGKRVSE